MSDRKLPELAAVAMVAWVCCLLAGHAAAAHELPHPQDGPHADVRILIDDSGVTFNIRMNLVFADEIVNAPREDPNLLHEVEVPALRDALLEYFAESNRVQIDGMAVQPLLKDFEKTDPDVSLLPLFPISGVRGISSVRIALRYPALSPPQEVAMLWGPYPVDILFSKPGNEKLLDIAAEMTTEGLRSNIFFTSTEPEYIWHATGESIEDRFLAVPDPVKPRDWQLPAVTLGICVAVLILALGVRVVGVWDSVRRPFLLIVLPASIAAAVLLHDVGTIKIASPFASADRLPTDDEALAIFTPLHANIYRAFEYTEESDIYDALARSVHGPLLDDLYNQIYRSLILYEEGGAVSRVERVTPREQKVSAIGTLDAYNGLAGFSVTARWDVLGTVYHWGHSHSRLNQYLAEYTVIETDAGWRIADNRIIEQERINLDAPLPTAPTEVEL